MNRVYSSPAELDQIVRLIESLLMLPVIPGRIPGALLEAAFAHVRQAEQKNTYDFVDVVDEANRVGWQIKSTKEKTPVTWKRAKLPDADALIKESSKNPQILGDKIIEFCNNHAKASMRQYGLKSVGFARLIARDDGSVAYYERALASADSPNIFCADDFVWAWSEPKKTRKKEQLSAFHGTHKPSGDKWWAWHGLGENQLHFSGERHWWPSWDDQEHSRVFTPTKERLNFDALIRILSAVKAGEKTGWQ